MLEEWKMKMCMYQYDWPKLPQVMNVIDTDRYNMHTHIHARVYTHSNFDWKKRAVSLAWTWEINNIISSWESREWRQPNTSHVMIVNPYGALERQFNMFTRASRERSISAVFAFRQMENSVTKCMRSQWAYLSSKLK